MPVVGMGGYFFRAKDPEGLKAWYRDHLGVGGGIGADPVTGHSNEWVWYVEGGPMVFSPFKAATDYFDPSAAAFMVNLRVDDLDAFLVGLKARGVDILGTQDEEYGKFAWIMDCDGIKIELWQQIGPAPAA